MVEEIEESLEQDRAVSEIQDLEILEVETALEGVIEDLIGVELVEEVLDSVAEEAIEVEQDKAAIAQDHLIQKDLLKKIT
jgi:hypothetical protein